MDLLLLPSSYFFERESFTKLFAHHFMGRLDRHSQVLLVPALYQYETYRLAAANLDVMGSGDKGIYMFFKH